MCIRDRPQTNEDDPGYTGYIISDEDSIIKKWLRLGASAWRLDVADELPDDFIFRLKSACLLYTSRCV